LKTLEAWSDNRFAELEAEVEVEGGRTLFGYFKMGNNGVTTIRKEKSLSNALEKSTERLILVEGEPGSGKSVALRHLTQTMARRASDSKNVKSLIPLYVNLKQLRHTPDQKIDQNLIEEFIHKSLNRINDRDIEDFLSEEFRQGIEDVTWLFLFDSFDEIPDVLSSTESDNVIRDYAEAISDFLHGMNNCRGIVASREYKGPRFLGWPKFRILPLALDRKVQLIKRTGLSINSRSIIVDGISQPATDFKSLTGNPMFLNLLCEYMRKSEAPEFPKHTHNVFNDYVWKRLTRDEERLKQRFSKTPAEIRVAAERLAYCMTADTGIGLSPTLEQLLESTKRQGLDLEHDFTTYISAIEYLKLARIEPSLLDGHRYFTFAHRRFQEYFATAIVMREPSRINLHALLSDARWRETAVVILQTQSSEQILPMFEEAKKKILDGISELSQKYKNIRTTPRKPELPDYSFGSLCKCLFEKIEVSRNKINKLFDEADSYLNIESDIDKINFPLDWPKYIYHVLDILQDGLASRYSLIPEKLQLAINDILIFILENGSLDDRKWAIDVVGSATLNVVERAVDIGFSSPGRWIKNAAFLQVARLQEIPQRFSKYIIFNLLDSTQQEFIFKRRQEIYAQFSRFADKNYLNAAILGVWMSIIDLALTLFTTLMVISVGVNIKFDPFFMTMSILLLGLGWVFRWRSEAIQKMLADSILVFSESMIRALEGLTRNIEKLTKSKKTKKRNSAIGRIDVAANIFMGSFMSLASVGLLAASAFGLLSSPMIVSNKSLVAANRALVFEWLFIITLLQAWVLVAIIEIANLKRTSLRWQFVYFAYPIYFGILLPYFLTVYLGEQFYIVSRLGIAIRALQKREKPSKILSLLMSRYIELALLPILLVSLLVLLLILTNTLIMYVIVGLFAVLELGFILYWIFTGLKYVGKEENLFKVLMEKLERLDVIKLITTIESLATKSYRTKLIRAVIDKQLLDASSSNITRLRNVVAFVQSTLDCPYSLTHFEQLILLDRELAIAFGYTDSDNFRTENNWNVEQLDLLCKLTEQIQQSTKVKL
jgi:hypothetical protein